MILCPTVFISMGTAFTASQKVLNSKPAGLLAGMNG